MATAYFTNGKKEIRLETGQNEGLSNIDFLSISGEGIVAEKCELLGILPDARSMTIYPNPAVDLFNVVINQTFSSGSVLSIYDNTGRTVMLREINGENNSVDISGLSKGIYVIKVTNGKQTEFQRIMKE